jgi:hypothetical protein
MIQRINSRASIFVKEESSFLCAIICVRYYGNKALTASFMEISELWMWIFLFKRTICLEETDVWFVLIWTLIQTEVIDEFLI